MALTGTRGQASDGEFVTGLARGLAVIEAFDAEHPEMTLADVARHTGLAPATARRSLHTLISLGYVKSSGKRFVLAARVLSLSASYVRSVGIETVLQPEIEAIAQTVEETVGIAVLVGSNIVYIAHHSRGRAIRPIIAIGASYPAYATSLGRMLLSGLSPEEIEEFLRGEQLVKMTSKTETDPNKLKDIILNAGRDGYCAVSDEFFLGLTSIAVPISDRGGQVLAALNLSVYTGDISKEALVATRLKELQIAANHIANLITRHPALLLSLRQQTS